MSNPQESTPRKVVLVGDENVGKDLTYVARVGLSTSKEVELDGRVVELTLWDTPGGAKYDRLRPLSYSDLHVILLCIAIDLPSSLSNVEEKWMPELRHFCPHMPIILVGCKQDLRDDPATIAELSKVKQAPVTTAEIIAVMIKPPLRSFSSEKDLEKIKAFFSERDQSRYKQSLQQAFETIQSRANWVERDGDVVEEWLRKNGYFDSQ
ncbi:hypothetical protein HWV62_4289 [Athelia sp. TMB]|nr:hypothetical protein HWV62_4289 [Athelia sp. TMB]